MTPTEDLIEHLVARAAPVRRARGPLARAGLWLALALGVVGVLALLHGPRPDLAARLAEPAFRVSLAAAVLTGALAAVAGDAGEPGAERPRRIVHRPHRVQRQQHVLHHVLHVRPLAQRARGDGADIRHHRHQQAPVGVAVAGLGGGHQRRPRIGPVHARGHPGRRGGARREVGGGDVAMGGSGRHSPHPRRDRRAWE